MPSFDVIWNRRSEAPAGCRNDSKEYQVVLGIQRGITQKHNMARRRRAPLVVHECDQAEVAPSSPKAFTSPKSRTLVCASGVTLMLTGFKSRWNAIIGKHDRQACRRHDGGRTRLPIFRNRPGVPDDGGGNPRRCGCPRPCRMR